MYRWIKQKLFYVKNVPELSLKKEYTFEKPQDYLQEQDKQLISRSQSLLAKNADTLTLSSYRKRLKTLARNTYSGIQGQIYD